jgi:hypothetical protein
MGVECAPAICEQVLGPEHLPTAVSLNKLLNLLSRVRTTLLTVQSSHKRVV